MLTKGLRSLDPRPLNPPPVTPHPLPTLSTFRFRISKNLFLAVIHVIIGMHFQPFRSSGLVWALSVTLSRNCLFPPFRVRIINHRTGGLTRPLCGRLLLLSSTQLENHLPCLAPVSPCHTSRRGA